tara:strand:+ start:117 stop:560 length:444 start_codon:yes stop_codon:yes gene_type:complete
MKQLKVLEINMKNNDSIQVLNNYQKINFFSLFASSGTIICCALPSLLVAVGAGASLSSFLGAFPEIILISQYKEYVFLFAFISIIFAGIVQWKARNLPCPTNQKLAEHCKRSRKLSFYIYLLSVMLLSTGFVFTFILPMLLRGNFLF